MQLSLILTLLQAVLALLSNPQTATNPQTIALANQAVDIATAVIARPVAQPAPMPSVQQNVGAPDIASITLPPVTPAPQILATTTDVDPYDPPIPEVLTAGYCTLQFGTDRISWTIDGGSNTTGTLSESQSDGSWKVISSPIPEVSNDIMLGSFPPDTFPPTLVATLPRSFGDGTTCETSTP